MRVIIVLNITFTTKENTVKKLLSLLMCIITVAALLVSCGSIPLKNSVRTDNFKETLDPIFTDLDKITKLSGATFVSRSGDLAYFTSDGSNTVYNFAKDEVVIDEYEALNVTLFTVGEYSFAAITSDEGYKDCVTKVYNEHGEKVCQVNAYKDVYSIDSKLDLFVVNNEIYRVGTDGKISLVVARNDFLEDHVLSGLDYRVGNYYYAVGSKSVSVFDNNLRLVSYTVPKHSEIQGYEVFILGNGNILIQTTELLPYDADEYTYFHGEDKYLLNSYIVKPDGTEKRVNLDYIVEYLYPVKDTELSERVGKGIDNIASIKYIEDHRVLNAESAIYSIDNNCKVKGALFGNLKHNDGNVRQLSENRFIYKDKTGGFFIVDKNGKEIARWFGNVSLDYNYKGIFLGEKFYDFDLVESYDITNSKGERIIGVLNRSFIFLDGDGGYKLYFDGSVSAINSVSAPYISDKYFITFGDDDCKIYSDTGKLLGRLPASPNYICGTSGAAILSVYDSETSEYEFYRLSRKAFNQ